MDGTNPNLVVNDMDRHVESDGLTHLMKSSSTASSRSGGGRSGGPLPVSSVNHLSLLCSSVEKSLSFYKDILGFIPVKRPGALGSRGAWLFNYGLGIHLIQASEPLPKKKKKDITPRDSHLSFQTECEDLGEIERRLKELEVQYIRLKVEEDNIDLEQIFFHDPDGFMIEVCTCENVPLVPLNSHSGIKSWSLDGKHQHQNSGMERI